MISKTLTYERFDGETVTETFNFHLSKTELIQMEMSEKGGLQERLEKMIKEGDQRKLFTEFRELILLAYGKREGDKFVKYPDLRLEFENSEALGELLLELARDEDAAGAFMQGIMPNSMRVSPAQTKLQIPEPAKPQVSTNDGAPKMPERPAPVSEAEQFGHSVPATPTAITRAQAAAMPATELQHKILSGQVVLQD